MITIGRKWPTKRLNGDYAVHCDYCGARWRRSQCRLTLSGKLACPDDASGKDELQLAEENAAGAAARRQVGAASSGGFYPAKVMYTGDDDPLGLTQRTTRDDI